MPTPRDQICRDIEHLFRSSFSIGVEVAPVRGRGWENVYRIYYAHKRTPVDFDLGCTGRRFCAPPGANGAETSPASDYDRLALALSERTNRARARWLVSLERTLRPVAKSIKEKLTQPDPNNC
jgi:hypothetical protein